MSIRIVFMGSPDFALPSLSALAAARNYQMVGVVTQPDRASGRGRELKSPPVKSLALELNIPVVQPEKLREATAQLQEWNPDLIVVAAFGQILKRDILDLPRYGCINVHASLLPRWRGAAPINAAILHGDEETGVTIMQMDAGTRHRTHAFKEIHPHQARRYGWFCFTGIIHAGSRSAQRDTPRLYFWHNNSPAATHRRWHICSHVEEGGWHAGFCMFCG